MISVNSSDRLFEFVRHERIGAGSQFGNDKWHALGHQGGNEGGAAREWAVQRARYMTLETISQMSDDPLISLPAVAR
ncbi:MAG: hypothetical protein EOQ28_31150 [Mesorhizobium sp.]|uniref:hypothetical protein n=1 Tax=Mesorhizobium sp. TaxID=1871066 RepID=UPI000FE61E9B|nr:MAG: hypothetical protein EOQ28_31150 [Mesorhizobium sp.]RWB94683.1 MAG: hypothetical protein EOQ57_31445 [Mesorhizobium sp.]RWK03301.1 MAG: hypothetical protein EOR39_29865 [Mesorhizobium sp.]